MFAHTTQHVRNNRARRGVPNQDFPLEATICLRLPASDACWLRIKICHVPVLFAHITHHVHNNRARQSAPNQDFPLEAKSLLGLSALEEYLLASKQNWSCFHTVRTYNATCSQQPRPLERSKLRFPARSNIFFEITGFGFICVGFESYFAEFPYCSRIQHNMFTSTAPAGESRFSARSNIFYEIMFELCMCWF